MEKIKNTYIFIYTYREKNICRYLIYTWDGDEVFSHVVPTMGRFTQIYPRGRSGARPPS